MKTRERILAALGLVGVIKPCCLLLWTSVFFGGSSSTMGVVAGKFAFMMPYENYFMWFAAAWLVIGQWEIWTALYRRIKSSIKTPWTNWVLKFTAIQVVTILTLYRWVHPSILAWNMNH